MISAKQVELSRIAQRIHRELTRLESDERVSKEDIERLVSLVDFQSRLKKDFPTLPFDVHILRRFGLNFLISILPTVVGVGIEIYKKFRP